MNDRALRSAPPGNQSRSTDSYARLGEIDVPTLIAVGTLDFPNVITTCRDLHAAIPGSRYVEITDTAHLPNLERPAAFNRLLADFLEQR